MKIDGEGNNFLCKKDEQRFISIEITDPRPSGYINLALILYLQFVLISI